MKKDLDCLVKEPIRCQVVGGTGGCDEFNNYFDKYDSPDNWD